MSFFNRERAWKFFMEEINSIGNNLLVNNDVSLNGNLNVNNVLFAHVPRGIICMWSGIEETIPNGWVVCDGLNGTPDLRDRFIVGAGNAYQAEDTGGEVSVTLSTNELPKHVHGIDEVTTTEVPDHKHTTAQSNSHYTYESPRLPSSAIQTILCISDNTDQLLTDSSKYDNDTTFSLLKTGPAGGHGHTIDNQITEETGGNGSHENRPPYYALLYIMKL